MRQGIEHTRSLPSAKLLRRSPHFSPSYKKFIHRTFQKHAMAPPQKTKRRKRSPASGALSFCRDSGLGLDALLQIELNHAETLLESGECCIEIEAEALGRVRCHDHTAVELHRLGRGRVIRVAVHTEGEIQFVDVGGDADNIGVKRLQAGRIHLDLGLLWCWCFFALGFFAHGFSYGLVVSEDHKGARAITEPRIPRKWFFKKYLASPIRPVHSSSLKIGIHTRHPPTQNAPQRHQPHHHMAHPRPR